MSSSPSATRSPLQRLSSTPSSLRRKLSFRLGRSGSSRGAGTVAGERSVSLSSGLLLIRRGRNSDGDSNDEFTGSTFQPFNFLSDDLAVAVISFVAYAPFEADHDCDNENDRRRLYIDYIEAISAAGRKQINFDPFRSASEYVAALSRGSEKPTRLEQTSFGTLTHVLPLVSKRFREYCRTSDALWSEATQRMVLASQDWRGAVHKWAQRKPLATSNAPKSVGVESRAAAENSAASVSACEGFLSRDVVAEACALFARETVDNGPPGSEENELSMPIQGGQSIARKFFVRVAIDSQSLLFSAPLFFLGGGSTPPSLGTPIGLHLFEPRYKLLIEEVMRDRSVKDRNGNLLSDRGAPRPRFVYMSGVTSPMVRGDPALIVEVARCKIHRDGRANVSLIPTRRATLLTMTERPNSGRLIDAMVRMEPRGERVARAAIEDGDSGSGGSPRTFRGPVFRMRAAEHPPLGAEVPLHFFEPRYRLLVREATEEVPAEHLRGAPIPVLEGGDDCEPVQRPRFVWAHGIGNFAVSAPAVIVEIRRCRVAADGTADLTIVPIKHATINELEIRPNSGGLYDASVNLIS